MSMMDNELEKKLWSAADHMRGNISSEQYMHIVIGIMFIKSMSDKYTKALELIKEEYGDKWTHFAEDVDILSTDYNCSFIIPEKARWKYISEFAASQEIGKIIDDAFLLIEEKNEVLKGLFDKNYNREELDQTRLGNVVSEFSNIDINKYGEDIIGRIYEYFLGQFFLKQGQKGGEFYTPTCIVKLLVELIEPKKGKIFDPACGTGGMFVQARKHLVDNNEDASALTVYGQEFQDKTWKLARINLLLQGFNANDVHLGSKSADSFKNDQHKGETFDFILANPPFNQKKWGLESLENDPRWQWGIPPKNNANYAWLSHMVSKLNSNGRAAVVLANGSLSGAGKEEVNFRKNIIEDNLLEMIISLPDKLFYTTGIPVSIWVFNKNKTSKDVLFVDGSNLDGEMLSKKLRILRDDIEIKRIKSKLTAFRNNTSNDEIGFSKVVTVEELKESDYSFVPGRYVGFVKEEIDEEKLKEEIKNASYELKSLMSELTDLIPDVENAIEKALKYKNEQ